MCLLCVYGFPPFLQDNKKSTQETLPLQTARATFVVAFCGYILTNNIDTVNSFYQTRPKKISFIARVLCFFSISRCQKRDNFLGFCISVNIGTLKFSWIF